MRAQAPCSVIQGCCITFCRLIRWAGSCRAVDNLHYHVHILSVWIDSHVSMFGLGVIYLSILRWSRCTPVSGLATCNYNYCYYYYYCYYNYYHDYKCIIIIINHYYHYYYKYIIIIIILKVSNRLRKLR